MQKITVIIPAFNTSGTISKTIESLENQDFNKDKFEVIVVDDGSTDDTKKIIEGFIEKKKINLRYFSQENQGPGFARNLGMKNAEGEIIAFTDSDCIVDSDWLSVIYKRIIENGDVIICGKTYTDEVVLFPWKISPAGQIGITANVAINRKILSNIYFDDKFHGLLGQDTDFLLRIGEKGYPYKYVPEMKIMHPVNVLSFKEVVHRCRSRMNEILLYKIYRKKIITAFNLVFCPMIFGKMSPLTLLLILFWFSFFESINAGMLYEMAAILLIIFLLFLLFFYKFLILNNPQKIPISFYDRAKTFFFLIVYAHLFVYYRLAGSIKFGYLLL